MQVKQMFAPLWNTVAKRYRAAVFSELSQVGLRYDDLYDPLKDEVRRVGRTCMGMAQTTCRVTPETIASCFHAGCG